MIIPTTRNVTVTGGLLLEHGYISDCVGNENNPKAIGRLLRALPYGETPNVFFAIKRHTQVLIRGGVERGLLRGHGQAFHHSDKSLRIWSNSKVNPNPSIDTERDVLWDYVVFEAQKKTRCGTRMDGLGRSFPVQRKKDENDPPKK